mgnify:CR=1 FL=1|tara:strand:- start:911 stop:1084 length:174 start_codon:yes stop_codon:yes gene_type:complete
MNRDEVLAGIRALRHYIDKNIDIEEQLIYFENILIECNLAVLLNEVNDPYSKDKRLK